MQKFLLTTALVLPLTAGIGFAQTSTTTTAPAASASDQAAAAASNAADKAGEAAGAAADAAGKAMDAAGEAAGDAVDAAGDAAKSAGDTIAEGADKATDAMTPAPAATTTTTTEPVVVEKTTTTTTTTEPVDGSVSTTAEVPAAPTPDDVMREQAANELRVAWINGSTVTSPDNENVGTIKDVIVDDSGMMKAVIVGVGGFLGIGEKQIAIDWSKLTIDYDANKITTNITREEAQSAPAYVFRDREAAPAPVVDSTATTTNTGTVTDPAVAPAAGTTTAPAN